jgi:multidrug transporter EmrE-like cation transporter
VNHYFSLIVSILIGIAGQISLKAGSVQRPLEFESKFLNGYVLAGLAAYGLAFIFYVYALRKIPVSVAFPSVSISYVAVAFLAHVIWGEPFGYRQILALLFIGLGITILYQGQP